MLTDNMLLYLLQVNEDLAVSLGRSNVEFEQASTKDDQESVGLAVSYTMGSMTIAANQ